MLAKARHAADLAHQWYSGRGMDASGTCDLLFEFRMESRRNIARTVFRNSKEGYRLIKEQS